MVISFIVSIIVTWFFLWWVSTVDKSSIMDVLITIFYGIYSRYNILFLIFIWLLAFIFSLSYYHIYIFAFLTF
jgi:hypothetical protein